MAKRLLTDPELTVEEVAKKMGVATSTLYRHISGGRAAIEAQAGKGLGKAASLQLPAVGTCFAIMATLATST